MLKIAFKSIGVFLLLCYLMVAGFIWRSGNDPMCYRDVKVTICDSTEAQFIEANDLYALLQSDESLNPIRKPIDSYDICRLENQIKTNPLVSDAHCYPTPDSLLCIDVYQRHPIMRIKSLKMLSGDYYLDTKGQLMAYQPSKTPVQVPLATGHISEEQAMNELFVLGCFLQKESFWNNAFTQIYLEDNGDIRLIPRVGNHTILLGPIDDFEEKLNNLKTFYEKALDAAGWSKYKTINLKFKGQVIGEKEV